MPPPGVFPGQFEIVASGICPQGLSAGQVAPNSSRCVITNGGTGTWLITADDTTLAPGNSIFIAVPGSGSNIPKGISIGQSAQVGNAFSFQLYRNDTGAAVDVEAQIIIIKQPLGRT